MSPPKTVAKFSTTVITNFLNNHYRNIDTSRQSITFKNYPVNKSVTDNKPTIDLALYEGVNTFTKMLRDELSVGTPISDIISRVFDLRLRACLDIADNYKQPKDNTADLPNVWRDFVIPQLEYGDRKPITIKSFIEAIDEFFLNDDKLKTKIFNTTFPHATHNPQQLPHGINIVYLQHVSRFHDDILQMYIRDGITDMKAILKNVLQSIVKNVDFAKYRLDESARLQLANSLILERVINPIMTTDRRGQQSIDYHWINDLTFIDTKGKSTGEPLDRRIRNCIRDCIRELMIAKSFVKIVESCKDAKTIVGDGEGDYTVTDKDGKVWNIKQVEVDYAKWYDEYVRRYEVTCQFFEDAKTTIDRAIDDLDRKLANGQIDEDEHERKLYGLFLRYFVDAVRFAKIELKYAAPMKTFVNNLKRGVTFKFPKQLRCDIKKIIDGEEDVNDDDIDRLAREYHKDWKHINSPKTYDANEVDIYGKIGRYCQAPLRKDHRIAVGVAIISYIQDQIRLIRAEHPKKKDIQIYIRSGLGVIDGQ